MHPCTTTPYSASSAAPIRYPAYEESDRTMTAPHRRHELVVTWLRLDLIHLESTRLGASAASDRSGSRN